MLFTPGIKLGKLQPSKFLKPFCPFINIAFVSPLITTFCPETMFLTVNGLSVKPSKVVFNFERILFRHCVDEDYVKGGDFEETELGGYLKGKFQNALEKKLGVNVLDCSLFSKENVFEKDSEEYMPFFSERKNRIKTLLDDSDTWYWWLKTPHSADSTSFCVVSDAGYSGLNDASSSDGGVAPAFAVGKCI